MANENRRKLYNAMQQAGYDIGDYDEFDRRMNNPQDRVKFYDAVQEAGYDIGGFGDFENRIKGSKYKLSANGREFQVSEREYKDFLARRNGTQPQATPQPTPQPQKPTTLSPGERQAMARQTQGLVDASGRNVARGKAYLQGLMQKPTFDTEPVRVGAKTNPNVVKQSSFNPETAEMEDTYLTQAGEFESEAMADFAQDEVDAVKKTNIERIDEQIAKLEAEKQRRSGAGGLPKGWGTAMYQSGMGVPQDNREDNDIDIALRDLRQAKTMYERNKQLHDSSDFLGGVGLPLTKDFFNNWKNFSFGVWDTLHDVGLYDFGVSDMAKAGAYNRIKNKLEKGEELSDHETDIAVAGMLLSAAQSETDLPLAYKTGEITANMAPFMAQMAANPASGLGKGLARKAVRKFGRDGIGAVAARVSARIGGNLAEAAVLSNTLQAGNVAADAMRRATGDTFINDENGEIKLGHYEKDDEGNPVFVEGGEDMALYKAEVSSLIENFTELGAGGSINKLLGKAATSNIGTRLGLSRINDFVKRMGTTDFAKATKRFMEKTHWDGMIEEPLEEEYGIILNSLLVGDNKLSDLFDSEQQAEIFAGTMWFGGFMAAMNTAAYPISRRRMKNNLSKADTRGQFELGEDWESWKERIDNMGDSEVKGLLYGIREDEQLTEAQKNAIFDYTIRLKQYQGSNVAGMLMRIENNVPQDDAVIEDAYEQGASIDEPADKNKAKELYDLRLQTATEVLGESTVEMLDDNPIPTLLRLRERGEEAEIRAALDYVNAKYAYDGMIDRVKDDIDVAQQQADYIIRRRTNFTTLGEPTIIPVITQQDKRMYITDGEVSALEDGSIDLNNSNDDLIAVDEEGNVTFLSAKDIKAVEEQINPAQALEETRNNIAQELSKKEADEIDGVLPFLPNDVYQGADGQGTPLQITILQDNGDGNVIANVTGLGEGVTLPKQTIQSWVDGLRMANLQQEEAERLAQYEPAEDYDYEPTQDIDGYEPVEDYTEYGNIGNDGYEYEQPFDGVTQAEAQAEAEQYQANRPAMEKIPVLQDAEGKPILNKKGRPQYQWTQAPVETTADALADLNDGILVDARDTAQSMKKQADDKLQKVKAQKVKGDDPIEEAESRKEIRNQVQAAQAEVDYWKNVTQEINRRMSAESARIQAEIEAKKTQEQREAEEAERKRIAAELDAKEREYIRKEIEKDSKKRNEPYKPLVEAKKEMADDEEAMAILNDTEPRDLAEWVSSLIQPHSMLWQDENGQRGLQSELGLNRSDIQKFISLLAQRDNGGKPFAEIVDAIYSELPDAMKQQYTDQDVRNTLLDLFNEGSVARMRNLAEEHRIEEARAQYDYNRRREEEAELQAWADAFHLSPEERESFEAWMEEDTPIPLSDEELAHIINIIEEQENEQQSGGSQEVGNEPDTRAEDTGNNELPSEQPRTDATQEPEQGSEDNAVEGENEPANVEQEPTATSGNGYTITPTKYTTKRGKELDMQLITFDNDLTKEQKRAADKFARDKKGWYDRNKNGYMMRSEADAEELAKLLGSEKAVQEAQPISLADIQGVTDEAESKPQEQTEATTETTEQPQTDANETTAETPQQEQQKEQPKEQQKPPKSKYVSDEDAERFAQLKERLRQKLLGQMNMGYDPEIFTLGVEMTYMIVKNQARKFADYAKAMIEEMGDAIRPYLKAFYNGARELPELEDVADELTPYEEVRVFDVTNFDKEGAKDLIKTAEVVAKEDEANNQAETAKEKITQGRNEKQNESVLSLPQPIKDNPNYSKEEQERLAYRKGESMEEYGERNNKYPNNWQALYLTRKYADKLNDIANVLSSLSAENANEAGKTIADIVESRSEGYELLSLLKNIPVDAVLPYQDAVSDAFKAKENINPEIKRLLDDYLLKDKEVKESLMQKDGSKEADERFRNAMYARSDANRELHKALMTISDDELSQLEGYHDKLDIAIAVERDNRKERALNAEIFDKRIKKQKPITDEAKVKPLANSVTDFASKEEMRPVMGGVYHDAEGYGVVSDGHILLASKELFDKKNEGKIIATRNLEMANAKKGEAVNGKYPDWRAVIPSNDNNAKVDWRHLANFLAGVTNEMKERWKEAKDKGEKISFAKFSEDANVALRLPDGSVIAFKANSLAKFVNAARQIGTNDIAYSFDDVAIISRGDKGLVMLMPVQLGIDKDGVQLLEKDNFFFYDNFKADDTRQETKKEESAKPQPEPKQEQPTLQLTNEQEEKPKKPRTSVSSKGKIEDVGEKIGGARKDIVQATVDRININGETFSKIFPKFDYHKLIKEGLDPKLAAGLSHVAQIAKDEYKRRKRRLGEQRALSMARFYANYAKGYLLGDTSLDFSNEGWVFTEYGKNVIGFGIEAWERLYDALGEDMFDIDLSGFEVGYIMKQDNANIKNFYYRDGERIDARYGIRAGQTKYFTEDEKGEALQYLVDGVKKAISYKASHPFKLGAYYTPGVKDSEYIGAKIGGKVIQLTPKGKEYGLKYLDEHNAELQLLAQRKAEELKEEKKNNKQTAQVVVISGQTSYKKKFAVKIGGKYVDLSDEMFSFETSDYTKKHLEEMQAKAQELLDEYNKEHGDGKGWKPEMNIGGQRKRVGKDWREGRDVSATELMNKFGFRGVEFGNYVTQKERQRLINECYDAFMDMADVLGVSPKALSLNGNLGMAIGARGIGGAVAHYEPAKNVINLTKKNGWGALAHEWWHSLDYYFGQREKVKSATASYFKEGVRKEMKEAFEKVMDRIKGSDYLKRSRSLDRKTNKDYYSKDTELGARAFQDYIEKKLTERGQVNDFLSHFTTKDDWNGERETYPYPIEEEGQKIGNAFENFFDTIQEREDENGNVVLFQRVDDSAMRRESDAVEEAMRDEVVRLMREAGIEVSTDWEAGQRILDDANADLLREMRAYHGSGADFNRFDHSFIGTGEGNQAFGWGTYVSEVEGVGKGYAKRIGDMKVSERRFIEGKIEEAKKYNIPAQVEYWENELERKNLKEAQHILYKVEIPQDNGSNYIDYFAKMQDQQGILDKIDDYMTNNEVYGFKWKRQNPDQRIQFRAGSRLITLTPNQSGADLYEEFKDAFGAKPASEILHAMGITGIKVPVNAMRGGNEKGEMNFVIFNENDLQITDKAKFFRTSNGEAYGFTLNGKIYLDPRIATAETPIHEYAHLWAQALREVNPKAWEKLKTEMLKEKDVVDYVKRLYPDITNEDELLEEVFTHYGGKRGAEMLRQQMQSEMEKADGATEKTRIRNIFDKLRSLLDKFWNMARDLFAGENKNIASMKGEDFADMMMNDLINGFNPNEKRESVLFREGENEKPNEEKTKVIFDAAKKTFGTTYDIREAGYILPDGTMLDFSGRHLLDKGTDSSFLRGRRTTDHREIQAIAYEYDAEGNEVDTGIETDMPDFIERGAIRIDNNAGTINLIVKPTSKQRDVLKRIIANNGGDITIDFGNGWNTDHSVEYESAKYPRILSDIDKYFDDGIRPEGNIGYRFSMENEETDTLPFYSNAARAVEQVKQDKATPEQWLKMIEKNGGLKSGEDKWIGLSDWLKASKAKSLTKQEVMDYIRSNQIQIEETEYADKTLGRYDEHWDYLRNWLEENTDNPDAWYNTITEYYGYRDGEGFFLNQGARMPKQVTDMVDRINKSIDKTNPINSTRLSYTTKGLDNKREIALTVPTIESWNTQDEIHFGDAGQGRAVAWVRFGETTDADGNRVLVIDEIQSKRHQEGREKGYKGSKEDFDRLVNARSTARIAEGAEENYAKSLKDKYNTWAFGPSLTKEEKVHWETLKKTSKEAKQREVEAEQKYNLGGAPSAPFEKNWHELAMKRMLRYAAENGYDKVAWTTGEQQAERYDIGGKVDWIQKGNDYGEKTENIFFKIGNQTQDVEINNFGRIVDSSYMLKGSIGRPLSDLIGKELAARVMSAKSGKEGRISGNDLRIGGEGMKGFYDEILPRFMNKYGKKWGAKVGTVELPNVEESARTMWAVDVTPEMKESVMQGQPMFRQTQQGSAQRTTMQAIRQAINDIIDKLHIADRVTVLESTEGLKGKKARAKGWFDVSTGKIVVVLPNNRNAADAMRTILHEAVAHMGLRQLFGKEFDNFLMDVYSNSTESVRRKINANAAKKGWDIREATEEYLASLAETQNFEQAKKQGIWNKVKEWFNNLLSKVGIPKLFTTSYDDNELRYILWRSWRNLTEGGNRDYLGMAEDVVKREDLGINDTLYSMRRFGGNRGYVGYSKSKRAVDAENRGLRSKSQMDKSFADEVNDIIRESFPDFKGVTLKEIKDALSTISADEWHHTSMYGNRTNYYSAETIADYFMPETEEERQRKEELDRLKKEHLNLFDEIANEVYDKIPSESIDDSQIRYFRTSDGNLVWHSRDIAPSKHIQLIPKGKGYTVGYWDEWAVENKGEYNKALDEYNAAKKAAVESIPQEKKDRLVELIKRINALQRGELYREDDANDDIRFREDEENEIKFDSETTDIWNDRRLSMTERITAAATRLAANQQDNKTLRNDAVRAISNNLAELNKAMSLQRKFDMATAKRIADLARVLMDGGYLKDIRQQEVKRLLAAVKNSVGHNDIENDVQKIMDILVDNQLRNAEATLHELETIKGSKVNASGVEVMGQLDPDGAHIMKAFKKYRDFSEQDIADEIANVEERMTSGDNTVADEAALDYIALQFAQEYAQNIKDSKTDEKLLRDEIKQTHDDASERERLSDAYRETIKALQDAIRQTKIERVQAYNELVARLTNSLRGSIENAKAFKEAEQRRIAEIHHNANSDMEGRPSNEHYKPKFKDKFVNNSLVQFLFQPLMTFEQMLRVFGSKSANGEGYLYNRFMRGWVDARQKEIKGVRSKYATLDAKAREIFGKNVKDWGGLIRYVGKLPKAEVTFWDGGEMRVHELAQGNLMYIYMVNKMLDGRMKLRKMGISEENVAEIEEMLDPRLKSLADWLQEDFLVKTRNEYNKTHKRMFGASMAAIENYFPLKILSNARVDNPEDLDNPDFGDTISTTTGSIIKRRRNTLALDITGADALNVILDHVAQMEHWNAFAEFKRDLNTLRTYKRFRNQVYNMNTVYGSGKKLWNKFNDVCRMAAGVYRPPRATLDEAAVNFAKGVTAAKVSFRVFTALKQFLSFPAYLPEARFDILMKNLVNPAKAWKWGMENLPIFNERWKSRIAGDPRLMKTDMDWKMWRTQVLQLASRWGMKPNAFVDALTVSMGAHAIYETKKKRYLKEGYSNEQAERKAIQDAEIAYNLTQQSSESAFTSTMQVDRSWLSVLLTVFRNSPMSYQRQLHNALRNFKHNMNLANYDARIEYMKKQYIRDGLDEETAEDNAENKYTRQLLKDWVAVATFGYVLQLAWNMGAYLPYLLFGGDDDEKDKMLDDVAAHTTFGSLEGLTGGDILSQAGGMLLNGEGNPAYLSKDMPLTSDISAMLKKVSNGESAESINDMIGLAVQSGIGVNPQSITDGVLGIMDVCGDDPALAHEAMICAWRILQVPQSQIDKLYFDEVGLSGEEVSNYTPQQLAQRYAQFKVKRGRLLAPWAWNDREKERKLIDKANKTIKERVQHGGDGEISEAFERAKEIYDEVKPTMSKANKAMQKSYIDSARVISSVPDEKVVIYNLYKKADENLDKLAKGYLNSNTHAQAELYRKAILDYRAAMADAFNATDRVKRERAIKNIATVMDDFKKKKKELNAEY